MGFVNRATLPEEFFDITSALLAVQPEPQYPHCMMTKMALAASFSTDSALGFMASRAFGGSGAPYLTDLAKDRLMLAPDGLYDQSIVFVSELGKTPGHTVRVNRPAYTNTTYTQAARRVTSGSTISTTPIHLSSEQVPITLQRFAGPYDAANARVAPYGIDRFDTSVMLHRPAQLAGAHLKRDFDRTVDAITVALFDNANTIVRPDGMVNDNTSALAGSYPMDFATMQSTERQLDDANIPLFPNGRRIMMLHPRQCEQLTQDAQFSRLSEFHRDMNPLFKGSYFKSCGGFDIFKSTTLTTSVNTNTITIYYGQAWGPGAVGWGQGEMPRVAYSTSDNYGEHALVVWLWYAGAVTMDHRFIARVTTD